MVNFMSFGWDCQVSRELKRMGFSLVETPVEDAGVRSIRGLNKLLRAGFRNFFLIENLAYNPKDIEVRQLRDYHGDQLEHADESAFPVFDTLGDVIDIHHFPRGVPFEVSYALLMERMAPDVFMKKLRYTPNLKVIRTNYRPESTDDIVEMYDIIREWRDGLPFEMFVFQDEGKKLGIPHLHVIDVMSKEWVYGKGWIGDPDKWDKILKMLTTPLENPKKIFI